MLSTNISGNNNGNPQPKYSNGIEHEKVFSRKSPRQSNSYNLETTTNKEFYQNFICDLDRILEDLILTDKESHEALPREYVKNLCLKVAMLKSQGQIKFIDANKITDLLILLKNNITRGCNVVPFSDSINDKQPQPVTETIMVAGNACLTALYILTSDNEGSQLYIEDIIDSIITFAKYQLFKTIGLSYNCERIKAEKVNKKRRKVEEKRQKDIIKLHKKMSEIIALLSELFHTKTLSDSQILQGTSLGVSSYSIGEHNLQVNAITLLTSIFSKYQIHRTIMLDDILHSCIMKTGNQHSYKFKGGQIKMFTALFLKLIQCIAVLKSNNSEVSDKSILDKYNTVTSIAFGFLNAMFEKCITSKSEDLNCSYIFNDLVNDLLLIINEPEWPGGELILHVIGKLLINKFFNKTDTSERMASINYLGSIACCLRRNILHNRSKSIDYLVQKFNLTCDTKYYEEKLKTLQEYLCDYLKYESKHDPTLLFSRDFFIMHWFNNNFTKLLTLKANKKGKCNNSNSLVAESEHLSVNILEERKQNLKRNIKKYEATRNGFVWGEKREFAKKEDIKEICIYLSSFGQFYQCFDIYLSCIVKALAEHSIVIRTKAMKSLTSIIEIDPSIFNTNIEAISHSVLDHSAQVREAALDLIENHIIDNQKLINDYYEIILARILDTSAAVRKKVVTILSNICKRYRNFEKIPDIYLRLVGRINDKEEGVKKLIVEVFTKMCFTPVQEEPVFDADTLADNVLNMVDAIALSNPANVECFDNLITSLLKPEENLIHTTKGQFDNILAASKQIVECTIETLIQLDRKEQETDRIVSCLTMLYFFSKTRPELIAAYSTTLQSYMSKKCLEKKENKIISYVVKILQQAIPVMKHPNETFLTCVQADLKKLIMHQEPAVVTVCISCLATIIINHTRNYNIFRDCFNLYNNCLNKTKQLHQQTGTLSPDIKPTLKRSLFVVGLLIQYFEFNDEKANEEYFPKTMMDKTIENVLYFVNNDYDSQKYALRAIGSICIRFFNLILEPRIQRFYIKQLSNNNSCNTIKIQILNNIENYLQEQDKKLSMKDKKWNSISKKENLKDLGDINSGITSTITQYFLRHILESLIHSNKAVRNASLKVIHIVLTQGYVNPLQIVPYLICTCTNVDKLVSSTAEKHLQDIEDKYPGYVLMKSQEGLRLSFIFQKVLNKYETVRGYRFTEMTLTALNWHLYSMFKKKQQKRSFLLAVLQKIENYVKTDLEQALYLADNLSCFPYQFQEEPLFIIYHINTFLSTTSSNILQIFKENMLPDNRNTRDDSDEETVPSEAYLKKCLPNDTRPLEQCIGAGQGIFLLGTLKKHLMLTYGLSNEKIYQYTPADSFNNHERGLTKKEKQIGFTPSKILQRLTSGKESKNTNLISEYLEVKQLIDDLDTENYKENLSISCLKRNNEDIDIKTMCQTNEKFSDNTITLTSRKRKKRKLII